MYLDLIESNWICLYKSYERIKDVGTPHWKQRNDHHFLFKTSSSACDCKRFPSHQCIAMTGCGVRWWYETCEKICDMQEINQINSLPAHRIMVRTAGQTDSQKRTRLADCLLIWQIGRKCSISISEWLFFLAATFGPGCSQGSTGGSNSPSFALFPLWENDHLCLASQRTLFWIHDNNLLFSLFWEWWSNVKFIETG